MIPDYLRPESDVRVRVTTELPTSWKYAGWAFLALCVSMTLGVLKVVAGF